MNGVIMKWYRFTTLSPIWRFSINSIRKPPVSRAVNIVTAIEYCSLVYTQYEFHILSIRHLKSIYIFFINNNIDVLYVFNVKVNLFAHVGRISVSSIGQNQPLMSLLYFFSAKLIIFFVNLSQKVQILQLYAQFCPILRQQL